jgi:hypothetical protein
VEGGPVTARVLTTTDAFFVAYQEQSRILMHFGAEFAVDGAVDRAAIDAAVGAALARWPALGMTLGRGVGGLRWRGEPRALVEESADAADIPRWRNTPIDPFREPPFGVLWVRRSARDHAVVLRCHHAVADGHLFFAIGCEVMTALGEHVGNGNGRGRGSGTGSGSGDGGGSGDGSGRDSGGGIGIGRGRGDTTVPAHPERAFAEGERASRGPAHPLAFGRLWREAKLGASIKHARWLSREAKADRSARIAMRAVAPGDVASSDRRLDARARRAVIERARDARVRPAWIAAAAWLQTLHAWNAERGTDNPMFSVEVPVTLRRGAGGMSDTGNHLAVLTLFADARAPIDELARGMWRDYAAGVRRRDHLAVPFLANPARLLPWPVFRRVAVSPTSTGFATTHFTWLAHEPELHARVRARSSGALAVVDQRIYTPVCLAMGAALCVLDWPDSLQLAITHRLTGLSADDAGRLGELLVERLA